MSASEPVETIRSHRSMKFFIGFAYSLLLPLGLFGVVLLVGPDVPLAARLVGGAVGILFLALGVQALLHLRNSDTFELQVSDVTLTFVDPRGTKPDRVFHRGQVVGVNIVCSRAGILSCILEGAGGASDPVDEVLVGWHCWSPWVIQDVLSRHGWWSVTSTWGSHPGLNEVRSHLVAPKPPHHPL